MIKLSQRDPRWATKTIGATKLTIGKLGCTTTAICMVADYFGVKIMPDQLGATKGLYNAKAEIIWSKLKLPVFKWEWRGYGHGAVEAKKIKQYLADPKKAVILQVANQSHWVVAVKATADGKSYSVVDPLGGVLVPDAIKKYGNITGAAYFSKM